ncbi:MAG: glycosyltransferase [Methylobacteriaceae bacterium]|nr:glycosyltransferase [Methylobacteriaceae bacterium]
MRAKMDVVKRRLVFVWDNFGPTHLDRCEAVARAYGPAVEVVGLELSASSETYEWTSGDADAFTKITLSASPFSRKPAWRQIVLLAREVIRRRGATFFFCHYEKPAVFASAVLARILGQRAFVMNDSKFDDYARSLWRELLKSLLYAPYAGAIVASRRAAEYVRFLGIKAQSTLGGYNTISVKRVRDLAARGARGVPFSDRDFIIIARLVEKKNISLALQAFALYRAASSNQSRNLIICGSGPLEFSLRQLARDLGIEARVSFLGFQQSEAVCPLLSDALALILPSTEEQFGLVVAEARALSVPVIISSRCGAADSLVRSGVDGFVIEPDSPESLAYFMGLLGSDEPLWRRLREASEPLARTVDARNFAHSVGLLAGLQADRAASIHGLNHAA